MARKRDYTFVWLAAVIAAVVAVSQFSSCEPKLVDVDPSAIPRLSEPADVATSGLVVLPLAGGADRRVVELTTAGDYDEPGWPGDGNTIHLIGGGGGVTVVVSCFAATEPVSAISVEVAPAGLTGAAREAKSVRISSAELKPTGDGSGGAASFPMPGKQRAVVSDLPWGKRFAVRVKPSDVGMVSFVANTRIQLRVLRHAADSEHAITGEAADADGFVALQLVAPPELATRTPPAAPPVPQIPVLADGATLPADAPLLPELRLSTGEAFSTEQTEVRLWVVDGRLHGHATVHDATPEAMVTTWTDDDGPVRPYFDDSMEFFVMPTAQHPIYYQLAISNTGVYRTYSCENLDAASRPYMPWTPESLTVAVARSESGYTVDWSIALADIELAPVQKGKPKKGKKPEMIMPTECYLQVVRNYRGQNVPGAVLSQLFPAGIYGDEQSAGYNHDRRAFMRAEWIPTP